VATRKEKVDAGLFLLIGVLLLAGTIAVVAGVNLERGGDLYLIKIPKSVGGLREGSAVKYLGVSVGRVKVVDFPVEDVESVRVRIEVTRPSTPIKSGTYATLSSNFLTGETSIDLQGGANEEAQLRPGSLIPWRPTSLMRLEDALPTVIEDLKRVVGNLNALLDEESRKRIARLLEDFDALAVGLHGELGPLRDEVRALREQLGGAGERIADEAGALRRDVTASVQSGVEELKGAAGSVGAASQRIAAAVDRLDREGEGLPELVTAARTLAERLDRLVVDADTLVDDNRDVLRRALVKLERSAREFEELVGQLRRTPSDVIFAEPPPEHERGAAPADKPSKGGGP
jgi:phospholipid/cholesterol/gamma-HCH transport system substrate-binding protein